MKRFIKFLGSLFLAAHNVQAVSIEKSTQIINTTGIPFSPQPTNLASIWSINATNTTNTTWAGCDQNASIPYCDELIEKNQTNSTKTCFEEKNCCEGDSDTGFITCPQTSTLSHLLYISIETISFAYLFFRCYCSRSSSTPLQYGVQMGFAIIFLVSSIYEYKAFHDPETVSSTLRNIGISLGSGIAVGAGTSLLLCWFENPRRNTLTTPLNAPMHTT